MDEPWSNLDAKLRAETRLELVDLHQRLATTFLYVTHDQVEAMAMASQRSSMVIESSSAATSVEAFLAGRLDPSVLGEDDAPSPSGLDLGTADFPGMVPGNRTQMGCAAWYLLNTVPDQVQAAAWDFITFINSNEAQVKLLTGGSFIPWHTSTLDDPEVVAYFESGLSGRWLRIAAEQLQRIDPDVPGPLIGPYDPETRDAIERAMESMLLNGVSPQQALERAQRDIDAALELYNNFWGGVDLKVGSAPHGCFIGLLMRRPDALSRTPGHSASWAGTDATARARGGSAPPARAPATG
jgi:hypothetical protein